MARRLYRAREDKSPDDVHYLFLLFEQAGVLVDAYATLDAH